MTTKTTTGVIADGAVGTAQLANDAVTADKIAANAVGSSELADGAVDTAAVADGAVTAAKMATTLDLSGKTLTLSAAQKASDYIEVRDEKAANTAGGTFTSGAWQTRTINTELTDTGNHASLNSNQITLAAGTYEADITCPGFACEAHQARLQNITDATTTLLGTCAQASASGTGSAELSRITGRFTIAAPKVFEVQHRCTSTRATDGFGKACNFFFEIYTVARFWKVG